MEKEPNFKFDVTLSHKGYDHKPTQVDYRAMQWVRRKLSINDFVALITEGYSYCHIYFGSRRIKEKFKQTQTVSIDVDEAEVPLKDFVDKCPLKPTFAYETFSNNNGKKKYRYRLVYIFKEPLYSNVFVQMYDTISCMIGLTDTKDHCGRVLSQLMNGTNKKAYVYRSNIIYSSLTDIVVPDSEPIAICGQRGLFPRKTLNPLTPLTNPVSIIIPVEKYFNNNNIYHNNQKQYKPKVQNGTNVLKELREPLEMLEMDRKGFLDFYGKIFKLTRWSKLKYNESGYCIIPDDYMSLFVRYSSATGKYNINRFKDGEKRRNRLFVDGCIIRKIKPDITLLELLYNLVHRVYHYYDNSDGVLSSRFIASKAVEVMNYDVE
ncbi:MAG: hypothetical protein NC102_02280 [Clostridium sp.]|nr:hypothetical protein [Clostridium sp.]